MRALVIALLVATPAAAQPVALDAFLAGAEKCQTSGAFGQFSSDIGDKYRNDFGVKGARVNPKVTVRIPPDAAAAVGHAKSTNKGEYTEVIVPVTGTWRGLPLAEIEFDLGNENGISVWSFRFAAPREAVVRAFGKDVAAAAAAFKRDIDAEFSVTIPKDKAAIVCDASN